MITGYYLFIPLFLFSVNTSTGIVIHGIFNGPIFVMVALGVME